MYVELSPRLAALIRDKVERGLYENDADVVRHALSLLEERDRYDRLRAAIDVGVDQVALGEVVDWSPGFWQRLRNDAAEEDRRGAPLVDDVVP